VKPPSTAFTTEGMLSWPVASSGARSATVKRRSKPSGPSLQVPSTGRSAAMLGIAVASVSARYVTYFSV
jgi:hypothetical protein